MKIVPIEYSMSKDDDNPTPVEEGAGADTSWWTRGT